MSWAEAEWERLNEYVPLSVDDATNLMRNQGEVASIDLLSGGKANSNYRVELTDGQRFVVRIYERDPDALEREANVLALVETHLPVPTLLSRGSAVGRPAGVFTLEPGSHPSPLLDAQDEAFAGDLGASFGRTLAKLGEFRFEQAGLFAPDLQFKRSFTGIADSFVDLIGWSLGEGRARKRLPAELRSRLAVQLDELARRLEPLDANITLTHGDYKLSNVLVDPDRAQVTALLDWEFASAFTPLLDIAILLRHRDSFPAAFVHGFESGYSETAVLPEDWRELTRIVDLMNLVGFLNAPGDRPKLYRDVIDRIAATADEFAPA